MTIRRGARGDRVRELQALLNRCGFALVEDGVFGAKTQAAVRSLQDTAGLLCDGIFGPMTRKALQARALMAEGLNIEVLQALSTLGHSIHDDGQVNLIGVRSSNTQANAFDDEFHIVWKTNGVWQRKWYPCTTDPGLYYLEHPTKVEGTAILCPGQYPVYKFDLHRGKYETLCQRAGTVRVWRDRNKDGVLDCFGCVDEGWHGINIHHAGKASTQVNRWSAGCQVFAQLEDWEEAMSICRDTEADLFTYTLITEEDLP